MIDTVAVTPSPSFLVRHPARPVLYAVNELPDGTVSAFLVGKGGQLALLAVQPTGGDSPCHLALAPDCRYLFVANYGSGSVSVHPLDEAGVPQSPVDVVTHHGRGPDSRRQERPHVHMVSPDPGQGPLLAVDLGVDSVYRYDLDRSTGRLLPRQPHLRTPAGTGPRHLARHPDRRRCYLVGELDGTLTSYELDADGLPHERDRVPASERTGHIQPSEVVVSPDGRFLYLANRGAGTLAVFALAPHAAPHLVAEVPTGGEWPRHFALADGYLYLADERAHFVRAFAVDSQSGIPTPLGEPVEVYSPACVRP